MPPSILLADDSVVARRAIRNLVTDSFDDRVTYDETSNGLDALDKAIVSKPDVVVLDIAMPGLNGVEAASRITERCPKTAVLAISNYDVEAIMPRFRQAGIRGFVPKVSIGYPPSEPYSKERAISRVNRQLCNLESSARNRDTVVFD